MQLARAFDAKPVQTSKMFRLILLSDTKCLFHCEFQDKECVGVVNQVNLTQKPVIIFPDDNGVKLSPNKLFPKLIQQVVTEVLN